MTCWTCTPSELFSQPTPRTSADAAGVAWTNAVTSRGKLVVRFWLKLLSGDPATICQPPDTLSTCAKFWTSTSLNTDMYTMMKVTIANIATAIPVRNLVDIG